MDMHPMQDPAAMPQEQQPEQGGFSITINVMPGGEITVSKGPVSQDAQGESFPTIKEALSEVLEMYRSNPVGGDEKADFEAGYGQPQDPRAKF